MSLKHGFLNLFSGLPDFPNPEIKTPQNSPQKGVLMINYTVDYKQTSNPPQANLKSSPILPILPSLRTADIY